MKHLSLFQEFDIVVYETDVWTLPEHQHNFFEIVYILEGKGRHILNENSYPYSKSSLFLLTPTDSHRFEVEAKSSFCIISFNKIYFSKEKSKSDSIIDFSELFKKLELIFNNVNALQGELNHNNVDKSLINLLVLQLIKEQEEKNQFYDIITQNCIFLILNLVARNIVQQLTSSFKANNQQSEIAEMVFYIQQHIYEKEKLKMEALANYFNKSVNYISAYFKEQTGHALKDYIIQYKLNLIKNRLLFSNMSISQIADEFSFSDESHLNKTFKQAFQMSAKEFRKEKSPTLKS